MRKWIIPAATLLVLALGVGVVWQYRHNPQPILIHSDDGKGTWSRSIQWKF